jgi:hypothetical protein
VTPTAALLALLLLVVVALIVSGPLRATLGGAQEPYGTARGRRRSGFAGDAALEAARAAKYREIRDAELDWRMGKLSDADYVAVDRTLRAEAIEILDRIGARGPRHGSSAEQAPRGPAETQPPSRTPPGP